MSTSSSSLRPGWSKGTSGGRGFQPPPTVTDRGDKGRSGSWGSQERGSSNKFAALDDDDDGFIPVAGIKSDEKPAGTSRSEAFRSSFGRQSSTGSKPSGRSLADLAARVPEPPGAAVARRSAGRFSGYRSTGEGNGVDAKVDTKVIRYTREKLLSMRVVPKDNQIPDLLNDMIGSPIISDSPHDPVCWDAFDSEEIWESFRERRVASGAKAEPVAGGMRQEATADPRRRPAPSGGRWQRGVALPPPEEAARKKHDNASNSDDLWDDPGGATGAAADFSAFGAMPLDDGEFDFDKMAEATRKIDEELHGPSRGDTADDIPPQGRSIDKARPLASAGMTISSGSGDDVNVFEDFDAPVVEEATEAAVQGGVQDPSASSRLMKMIGVQPPKADGSTDGGDVANPWGGGPVKPDSGMDSLFGSMGLSLNPWGGAAPAPVDGGGGVFTGRLEGLAEQRAREQKEEIEKRALQEAELRRQQQEEAQRHAMAQRQAEEQARVAALQQQPSQQSQVELVLMERICSILENSWGRSDLSSALATLHSEDSRVIPLLGNVEALRALIARSPQRIALRRDPSFSGELAVLLMTNSQWQQQQQAQARHQEELRRRQLQEARQAQSRQSVQIDPSRPWFYSDPQSNIQGPFRGEEMRQWLEAGYFKGDLPISQQPTGPFHLLSMLFPDLNHAFRAPLVNDNKALKEEAERQALEEQMAEEKRRAAEARAAADRAEAERQAAEAAVAAQAEAQKMANNGDNGNESSTKLKMMLGLSGAQEVETASAGVPMKQTVDTKNLKVNKKSQQNTSDEAPVVTLSPSVPAKPVAAVWGGTADAKPKKSISEIQQEEARRAAMEASQGGGVTRQSSGWANVAAGTQGWSSGVVKKTSTQSAATVATSLRPAQATRNSQPSFPELNKAPALSQQQRSNSTASGPTFAEDFGASMSPALEAWCKEQMQKLNGSDDLTLIAFCMTLTDANEIRQYLQAYLGGGPKVSSFAAEFIVKRGLGHKQEEWETPGSAKKGRKKKVGAR